MINEGDSRLHMGVNGEQILKLSRQGHIVPYMLKILGIKEHQATWRESIHSQLWDSLTSMQQEAWKGLHFGFTAVTYGIDCKARDYSGAKGAGIRSDDHGYDAQHHYRQWADLVRHRKMKLDMLIDIIGMGKSVPQAARDSRPATTRYLADLALREGLNIYCRDIRGWR